jgi:hypothetical protein
MANNAAVELLGGSAWQAESHFGWNRHTVEPGLRESASASVCADNSLPREATIKRGFAARGNHKARADARSWSMASVPWPPPPRPAILWPTAWKAVGSGTALAHVKEWVINKGPGSKGQRQAQSVPGPAGQLCRPERTAGSSGVLLGPATSKYNPIERCSAALERHWRKGTLLSIAQTALRRAQTMTCKGLGFRGAFSPTSLTGKVCAWSAKPKKLS